MRRPAADLQSLVKRSRSAASMRSSVAVDQPAYRHAHTPSRSVPAARAPPPPSAAPPSRRPPAWRAPARAGSTRPPPSATAALATTPRSSSAEAGASAIWRGYAGLEDCGGRGGGGRGGACARLATSWRTAHRRSRHRDRAVSRLLCVCVCCGAARAGVLCCRSAMGFGLGRRPRAQALGRIGGHAPRRSRRRSRRRRGRKASPGSDAHAETLPSAAMPSVLERVERARAANRANLRKRLQVGAAPRRSETGVQVAGAAAALQRVLRPGGAAAAAARDGRGPAGGGREDRFGARGHPRAPEVGAEVVAARVAALGGRSTVVGAPRVAGARWRRTGFTYARRCRASVADEGGEGVWRP